MAQPIAFLGKALFIAISAYRSGAAPHDGFHTLRLKTSTSALEVGHHPKKLTKFQAEFARVLAGKVGRSTGTGQPDVSPGSTVFLRGGKQMPAWTPITAAGAPGPSLTAVPGLAAALGSYAAPSPSIQSDPNPEEFFERVASLLTCQDLESLVDQTCKAQPLWMAIPQFENNVDFCNAAAAKIADLLPLFVEYFGPGSTCNTLMQMWMFQGFNSEEECETSVRTDSFKKECRLI
mmetsp:Transcript_121812/g.191213  ORF Transcript_121812/g.191213 Transcript_121812/m.191213 type:complete len:234 (-) Transcript_121812:30-731(-)